MLKRYSHLFLTLSVMVVAIANTVILFAVQMLKEGNFSFFIWTDHVTVFFSSLLVLVFTLLAWVKPRRQVHKWSGFQWIQVSWIAFLMYSLAIIALFTVLRWMYGLSVTIGELFGVMLLGFAISFLPVHSIFMAYLYFTAEKQSNDEKRELHKQLLAKQMEPHFLFNSLSALAVLMKTEEEQATIFLDDLTAFYRFFLKHNAEDLVKLETEIEVLSQYFRIMSIRSGGAYTLQISNYSAQNQRYIVPFALQIGVENAIKHNKGTYEAPLPISVRIESEYVQVAHPFKPYSKKQSQEGLGLQNLKKRYELLGVYNMEYGRQNEDYILHLPVLKS